MGTLKDLERQIEGKEIKKKVKQKQHEGAKYICGFPIILMVFVFFLMGYDAYTSDKTETGIITDKYEGNKFEINNNTIVEVDAEDYRHYEVGDEYTYRKGDIIKKY